MMDDSAWRKEADGSTPPGKVWFDIVFKHMEAIANAEPIEVIKRYADAAAFLKEEYPTEVADEIALWKGENK